MSGISQVIIIPPGTVAEANRKLVIHIPSHMKDKPVLLANARQMLRTRGGQCPSRSKHALKKTRSELKREIAELWSSKMCSVLGKLSDMQLHNHNSEVIRYELHCYLELLERLERDLLRKEVECYRNRRKLVLVNFVQRVARLFT